MILIKYYLSPRYHKKNKLEKKKKYYKFKLYNIYCD